MSGRDKEVDGGWEGRPLISCYSSLFWQPWTCATVDLFHSSELPMSGASSVACFHVDNAYSEFNGDQALNLLNGSLKVDHQARVIY